MRLHIILRENIYGKLIILIDFIIFFILKLEFSMEKNEKKLMMEAIQQDILINIWRASENFIVIFLFMPKNVFLFMKEAKF